MKDIIVCVKQVPNTTNIRLDPVHHTLVREGVPSILNPFDEVAIDAALDCKSRFGMKVALLSMGPPQAVEMLEPWLARGVDDAFLLTDRRLAGSDTLATSRALHAAILRTGYPVVFCGQETADSSTAHIGASLAEMFHVPQVTSVTRILDISGETLEVEVTLERCTQVMAVHLPAVVSFAKAERATRTYAAKRGGAVRRLSLEDISLGEQRVGLEGSPTAVVNIDVDLESLNYMVVDDTLGAFDRIGAVLSGGIRENKNRRVFRSLTEEACQALLSLLK
jgi:electron transfer flavoprotein alpha/beta subunit